MSTGAREGAGPSGATAHSQHSFERISLPVDHEAAKDHDGHAAMGKWKPH